MPARLRNFFVTIHATKPVRRAAARNVGEDELIGYVELHTHGKVTTADIAEVIFYGVDPPANLVELLRKHGVQWRVVQ